MNQHTAFRPERNPSPSGNPSAVTRYTRQDVLRILRLPPTLLTSWERSGIFPAAEDYSFADLSRLRVLQDLTSRRLSVTSIRASIQAMQQVSGMSNPLLEATAVASGRRLVFRHSGMMVDPIRNQFLLDFETSNAEGKRLSLVTTEKQPEKPPTGNAELQRMFTAAVALEESPSTHKQAMEAYEQILQLFPNHAPSAINMGTLLYNQRQFAAAEEFYRRATIMDPNYALAFFDLGNVLDELQRLPDAIEAYKRAIALVPTYADAHYNLALAYERTGYPRKALRHWNSYTKLDPVGPWANHARIQQKKALHNETLTIVHRRSSLADMLLRAPEPAQR